MQLLVCDSLWRINYLKNYARLPHLLITYARQALGLGDLNQNSNTNNIFNANTPSTTVYKSPIALARVTVCTTKFHVDLIRRVYYLRGVYVFKKFA